jgi:hypothetical protein
LEINYSKENIIFCQGFIVLLVHKIAQYVQEVKIAPHPLMGQSLKLAWLGISVSLEISHAHHVIRAITVRLVPVSVKFVQVGKIVLLN